MNGTTLNEFKLWRFVVLFLTVAATAVQSMYVCMYVCMHACMHACMHVRRNVKHPAKHFINSGETTEWLSYLYGRIIKQNVDKPNGNIKLAEITHCSATCRAAKKYRAGTGYDVQSKILFLG